MEGYGGFGAGIPGSLWKVTFEHGQFKQKRQRQRILIGKFVATGRGVCSETEGFLKRQQSDVRILARVPGLIGPLQNSNVQLMHHDHWNQPVWDWSPGNWRISQRASRSAGDLVDTTLD